MRKAFWLAILLLGLMAAPSAAIFLSCDELCNCANPCSRPCRFTPTSPLTNCGAIGVCVGGADCSGLASASASSGLDAIFSPAVCTEEPGDSQPAATMDSATSAEAPTPAPAAD